MCCGTAIGRIVLAAMTVDERLTGRRLQTIGDQLAAGDGPCLMKLPAKLGDVTDAPIANAHQTTACMYTDCEWHVFEASRLK